MSTTTDNTVVTLEPNTNQARGIADFAISFIRDAVGEPSSDVLERATMFHTDSVLCALSAIAMGTNAPLVLRNEAMEYPCDSGATIFGCPTKLRAEKAILANSAAAREWDSNGTNFGYNAALGHVAGEFGHNDFYPVPIAAAQMEGLDGAAALRGMICLDEIRGRLAEVFSLKSYKIDHVVHGAIASAAVYGAMRGATPEQIESAIGMFVAHYIPWRAIRAGKQLSDSKGASAAISTEAAILCMNRSMNGFIGPADIFRNPEAIWRQFEPTDGDSPFRLVLSHSGDDFAVMGMHFKLGLYEHQSAGALQGLIDLIHANPDLLANPDSIRKIRITAYEPAFGIIGDPAKRDPRTRQSADHSMLYIVSTMLRKAIEKAQQAGSGRIASSTDETWKLLMLAPNDYDSTAIFNDQTRSLMELVEFEHGGDEYDRNYPDGIPTSISIETSSGDLHESGMVMYPAGHARNTEADLAGILEHKALLLGGIAMDDPAPLVQTLENLGSLDAGQLAGLWDFTLSDHGRFE